MRTITLLMAAALAWALSSGVRADVFEEQLLVLQEDWARVQYQVPEGKRADRFEALHDQAEHLARQYPDRAEPLIWDGIILSTWAGAKGGLGALSLVKQARGQLEKSLEIDPDALDGSAYTSLGSLYYQVPGWPLGFGDDEKAESLLKMALVINPNGIDPNYFYADYLMDQGKKERAREYFRKALQAPPRPDRPIADSGRQHEIREKLEKLEG